MQGMLLGIIGSFFSGILSWIAGAIGQLLSIVIQALVDFIVKPIIWLVLKMIAYTVGYIAYVISTFILKLVDFVEILFRALAGLGPTGADTGMSVELSINGDSGDILIQLIRNPDIQQAFLSMCIVGLFLLVVTTVFQIIKVEYTTEGAKNSKTPILQKAFKSMANLMLLPLLVIFGIVFANQLLGLLDKATSINGDNPTISGLIFVASASEAHYLEDEDELKITHKDIVGGSMDAIGCAITYCFTHLGDAWGLSETSDVFKNDPGKIDQIEGGFISQADGYKYYDITQVTEYYNYSAINYLLLLFGGVFVLKCLFFTCFGMVIRLYKCAILFIIAPAVIGMTPINEGGLGKWRTAFIGQVLAAYGTVLSLNLFFVVVRVLINIDVTFTIEGAGSGINFLSNTFMEMLLKSIFVLAGVLLIEKFSKELGGYFGAEDAMGAGKDMANQVGDMAMKGVAATAMVATGGAGLAMKAGKFAGGIASKVGKSGIGQAVKNSKVGQGIASGVGKVKDFAGDVSDKVKNSAPIKGIKKATGKVGDFGAWMANGQAGVDARHLDDMKLSKEDQAIKDSKEKDIAKWENLQKESGIDLNAIKQKQSEGKHLSKKERAVLDRQSAIDQAKQEVSDLDNTLIDRRKNAETVVQDKKDARVRRGNRLLNAVNTVEGLAQTGRKNMWGSKYLKQFDDAAASGGKALGNQFEVANKNVNYLKEKEKQDMAAEVMGGTIDKIDAAGAMLVAVQSSKELQHTMERLGRDITRSIEQLNSMRGHVSDEVFQQQQASMVNNLNAQGANIDFQGLGNLMDKVKIGGKIDVGDIGIKFNPKDIEKAVKDAMSKGAINPEEIKNAVMEALKDVDNANLLKMISDIIEKQISNLNK